MKWLIAAIIWFYMCILVGELICIDSFFFFLTLRRSSLHVCLRPPLAFLSTEYPILVFVVGESNFPMKGFQQVLNFSNYLCCITDDQFTSRSYYSIHLCHHGKNTAPVKNQQKQSSSFLGRRKKSNSKD